MLHPFDRETLELADSDLRASVDEALELLAEESPFRRAERIGRLKSKIENGRSALRTAIRLLEVT